MKISREILMGIPGYDPFKTAAEGEWFDHEEADRAMRFFPECLTHIEGKLAGKPFELILWQKAIIANLFGWRRADGTRRYREAFILVPRKNGKTPLAAGIALYLLCCDGEIGAQVYSAGADREQAALIFRWAAAMVLNEPELEARCSIYKTTKAVEFRETRSIYKALSADAKTKHGLNIHGALIDELHAHPTGELTETLKTGTASREQPLIVYTTTADYQRESICNRTQDRAEKVRDGVIEDSAFMPVIYAALEDEDWTDPGIWKKANPNFGISVDEEYFKRECKRAQDEPSYLNTFLRLHLNVRTGSDVAWIDVKQWDRCRGETDYRELPALLKGSRCYAGLDLAKTRDLTSLALWFPEQRVLLNWYWIPASSAARSARRDRVPYLAWKNANAIEFTPGDVTDYAYVEARILEIISEFEVTEFGYDPWNATATATNLQNAGIEMVEVRQGYRTLSEPSKELERMIIAEDFSHGGQYVTRWCASNVMVDTDPAGNIKPSKAKSTQRIDGIVAAVIALSVWVAEDEGASVYEQRGVLRL